MSAEQLPSPPGAPAGTGLPERFAWPWDLVDIAREAVAYGIDTWQRSILVADVWRRRANQAIEHTKKGKPPVLGFDYEIVVDGRTLERPCNYLLMRILPQSGQVVDPKQRPFVIIDPRAGHGPGISGFKPDSQIGYVLRSGHPCYFIGFRPEPEPGQTLEDVALAEASFIDKVSHLHPEAAGKPCVIGNCQAGWALMALTSVVPELMGPLIIAGSPLSYWAGIKGHSPMRYVGGLLGGTWTAALASDLGHGRFDGAHLVSNFENLNPANTYWEKPYNLFANIDTEGQRFLEFEKWWGGYYLLNAAEIQGITDGLFVGNKLAVGQLYSMSGYHIDLRNIRSPILIFASYGDNITPPPQALGWILDLYSSVDDIRSREQTIIYNLHHDIGHLGIFVSTKVAKKETVEFIENIDLIELLPPGLYELILEKSDANRGDGDVVPREYFARFEARTLDDLRQLVVHDPEDDLRFATTARISDINLGLYQTFVSPFVRQVVQEPVAEWLRLVHPGRQRNFWLSDANPYMQVMAWLADVVRATRQPAAADNLFLKAQAIFSQEIIQVLDTYRDWRDANCERLFMNTYGSPLLQSLVGLKAPRARPLRVSETLEPAYRAQVERRFEQIRNSVHRGGLVEAMYRALVFMLKDMPGPDERMYRMMMKIRAQRPPAERAPMSHVRAVIRSQSLLMQLDEERAMAALPRLVPSMEQRRLLMDTLQRVLSVYGPSKEAQRTRLSYLSKLLELDGKTAPSPALATQAASDGEGGARKQIEAPTSRSEP